MRTVLLTAVLISGSLLAQPPRQPLTQFDWWTGQVTRGNSLNLSEVQLKQVKDISQAYYATLKDLRDAVTKSESNLNEIYNQDKIDELKAGVAVDQYVNARTSLTRVLAQMSLKMRTVLTPEQWQQLEDIQSGRAARGGRGRGRGGAPGGSGPAISQKQQ
jgi:Spy/CpxP family protein refolding chaperone